MAEAYSVFSTGGPYLSIEEVDHLGHIKLSIKMENSSTTITLDGEDLARALLTASPSFSNGVAAITGRAIFSTLGRAD